MPNLKTNAPIRKIRFGTSVGASVCVVVWLLHTVWKVEVPPEVASAMTVIVSSIVAYFTKSSPEDLETEEPQ